MARDEGSGRALRRLRYNGRTMSRIVDALTGGADKCVIPGHGADSALPEGRDLAFTPEVERETAPLYERVRDSVPAVEWPLFAPFVHAINRLKREEAAAPPAPPGPSEEVMLLREIRDALKK